MERARRVMTGFAGGAGLVRALDDDKLPEVTHYNVFLPALPKAFDGLRIAHLSDLHNKVYGKYNIKLYERIAAQDPDLVVMTGDMVSHRLSGISSYLALVRLLGARFPLYYVNGNHELSDMDDKTFEHVRDEAQKAGAVCLDNSCAKISRGRESIGICGLCYQAEYYRGVRQYKRNWSKFTIDAMTGYLPYEERRLEKNQSSVFTILLAHNPLDFQVHARWGANVSFGGHIHGGFVRLPFIKGIISPELKLMPKYKEGVYYHGDSALVVSRGLGRIRLFNRPEIVIATLVR